MPELNSNRQISLILDPKVYSKEAILKCLYWYSDNFNTDVSLNEDEKYLLSLTPNSNSNALNEKDFNRLEDKLKRDLLDFQLRMIIHEETKNIRDLLTAKAFSSFDTEEEIPQK